MQTEIFTVSDFAEIKLQLLTWANRFSSCCFLDNHEYQSPWKMEECLVAAGAEQTLQVLHGTELDSIQQFITHNKGEWIFGHFGYDLKNAIHQTTPASYTNTGFAPCSLFVPQVVVKLSHGSAVVFSRQQSPANIWAEIVSTNIEAAPKGPEVVLSPALTKEAYQEKINLLRQHIHRGDCYEINFCQEFFCHNASISPVPLYAELARVSPNPFSCYYRQGQSHLLCASPERFIARNGNRIFSQPIKGTAPRTENSTLDAENIRDLLSSKKERSENVMVVDLVRNDLSKVCREGSVLVDELFGIYTFPHVHQMISTISGELMEGVSFTDILAATFPMGSMTGAPKKRVMELIDAYETGNRGIFSGAVGYIAPNGNFDFNVVIRSLIYNEASNYLSYWVGSGITWYSQPEAEYEECMLKAAAIIKVLQNG